MDAPVTSAAATTPGRAAAAAPSAPERSAPPPVIVACAVYMVAPSQTSPTNSWVTVPAVPLAMHPTLLSRRIDQGSYARDVCSAPGRGDRSGAHVDTVHLAGCRAKYPE